LQRVVRATFFPGGSYLKHADNLPSEGGVRATFFPGGRYVKRCKPSNRRVKASL